MMSVGEMIQDTTVRRREEDFIVLSLKREGHFSPKYFVDNDEITVRDMRTQQASTGIFILLRENADRFC